MLDGVEGDLEDDLRANQPHVSAVLDGHVEEPLCELGYLGVSQAGVGLADVDQAPIARIPHGEGVVREHASPLAVAPFDSRDNDVEGGEGTLQLQPRQPAAPGRVWAQRVFDHEPFVAASTCLGEDPVEVVRVGRLLQPREQVWVLESQPLEQLATGRERFIEERAPVEPQQVEDHEHDGYFAP